MSKKVLADALIKDGRHPKHANAAVNRIVNIIVKELKRVRSLP